MGEALLGETFDIHGGGIDLVFPHHENEIAQSEGVHHDHPLARIWMHNGFLQVEGEKMSKSLGNFVTIRQLMRRWEGEAWSGSVIKLAMLRTHYRQPLNWTLDSLNEAKRELSSWVAAIRKLSANVIVGGSTEPSSDFIAALSDDLNTPESLSVLRQLNTQASRGDRASATWLYCNLVFSGLITPGRMHAYIQGVSSSGAVTTEQLFDALDAGEILKVAYLNNDTTFQAEIIEELRKKNLKVDEHDGEITLELLDPSASIKVDYIRDLIAARTEARKAKNFKESDRIRDELLAKGIVLKDSPAGTTWEVKR